MSERFEDRGREAAPTTVSGYDAVLVVSFGGPEGPDDVMPFLENVFRGLRVTDETKQRIAARYHDFGGVSPINAHTRAFVDALGHDLAVHGIDLPIYWGNRNWHPYLADTVARMAADGIEHAIAYVTSTFSSYSSCRKYREDLYEAWSSVDGAPTIDRLRSGFNHPGFIAACADRLRDALAELEPARREGVRVLFTAHSLPESMARHASYVAQLTESCRLVAEAADIDAYDLVYQSNNARYGGEPWLGPDISEALVTVRETGARDAVVMPIGFVCDHMEVVLDLDVVAARDARKLGINMVRAGTVGTHPRFVGMVRELVVERTGAPGQRLGGTAERTGDIAERLGDMVERSALGALGPAHDECPSDCCLSGRPGPPKPALGGVDAPAGSSFRAAATREP